MSDDVLPDEPLDTPAAPAAPIAPPVGQKIAPMSLNPVEQPLGQGVTNQEISSEPLSFGEGFINSIQSGLEGLPTAQVEEYFAKKLANQNGVMVQPDELNRLFPQSPVKFTVPQTIAAASLEQVVREDAARLSQLQERAPQNQAAKLAYFVGGLVPALGDAPSRLTFGAAGKLVGAPVAAAISSGLGSAALGGAEGALTQGVSRAVGIAATSGGVIAENLAGGAALEVGNIAHAYNYDNEINLKDSLQGIGRGALEGLVIHGVSHVIGKAAKAIRDTEPVQNTIQSVKDAVDFPKKFNDYFAARMAAKSPETVEFSRQMDNEALKNDVAPQGEAIIASEARKVQDARPTDQAPVAGHANYEFTDYSPVDGKAHSATPDSVFTSGDGVFHDNPAHTNATMVNGISEHGGQMHEFRGKDFSLLNESMMAAEHPALREAMKGMLESAYEKPFTPEQVEAALDNAPARDILQNVIESKDLGQLKDAQFQEHAQKIFEAMKELGADSIRMEPVVDSSGEPSSNRFFSFDQADREHPGNEKALASKAYTSHEVDPHLLADSPDKFQEAKSVSEAEKDLYRTQESDAFAEEMRRRKNQPNEPRTVTEGRELEAQANEAVRLAEEDGPLEAPVKEALDSGNAESERLAKEFEAQKSVTACLIGRLV